MKEYLIAVDMEGVHGVKGEPYEVSVAAIALGTPSYQQAVASATQEVNVAVDALFASGADRVVIWDNHAARDNLDFSKIDPRAEKLVVDRTKGRLEFLKDFHFEGIVFIGYHSRAGSINGTMAHTYNGFDIQYMKVNGKQLGEFDFDSHIAGEYGVPPIFAASDDVCVRQVLECNPDVVTVVTKYAKGRRKADFRDENEVLSEIAEGVRQAAAKKISPVKFTYPCAFEIRYSSMDVAEWRMAEFSKKLTVSYGEDAHTLCVTLQNVDELRMFL